MGSGKTRQSLFLHYHVPTMKLFHRWKAYLLFAYDKNQNVTPCTKVWESPASYHDSRKISWLTKEISKDNWPNSATWATGASIRILWSTEALMDPYVHLAGYGTMSQTNVCRWLFFCAKAVYKTRDGLSPCHFDCDQQGPTFFQHGIVIVWLNYFYSRLWPFEFRFGFLCMNERRQ